MSDDRYFVGIDVGTSYVKSVLIDNNKDIVTSYVKRTGTSIEESSKIVFEKVISDASLSRSAIKHITATGYGKSNVSFANTYRTEISCHAKGAYHYFPKKITVIDIGGQDTKIIKL
jgi:activator of 2-hydroxyglutaryl-CoA dehydratase